jgi:predicted XRE-type DNA-binding protein
LKRRRFDSVWDAIERSPDIAASLRLRADIMHAILAQIERSDLTQTSAAARAAISQPRMSDLMRGRLDCFSLDALVEIAARLGLRARISFQRQKAA